MAGRGAWVNGLVVLALVAAGSGAVAQNHSAAAGGGGAAPDRPASAKGPLPVRQEAAKIQEGSRAPSGAPGKGRVATADPRPDIDAATPRPGVPRRIVVPGLGVQAPVVPIVAVKRVLLPPSDPQTIGWWADGAKPGARTGSAVLTGHTVHSGGGAFDDLDRLRPGQPVAVVTAQGRTRYAVRDVTDYPKQTFAAHAAEVFDQEVPGRLVLITCENWNGTGYDSNTVVVAEPIR